MTAPAPSWSLAPGAVAAGRDLHVAGPVSIRVVQGSFDRLADAIFDPAELAEQLDLARFTGRRDLIRKIDGFIASHDRGYVLVRAEAGVGKSALAAHLVWTRPCAHHFTRLGGGARIPEEARKSLAAQLIGGWGLAGEFAPATRSPPAPPARTGWARCCGPQPANATPSDPASRWSSSSTAWTRPNRTRPEWAPASRWTSPGRPACRPGYSWWRPAGSGHRCSPWTTGTAGSPRTSTRAGMATSSR